jgi:hypothetical protein
MPGLLRGLVRTAAIAGTATAVSNRVSRRQAGRWARHDAQQQQVYAQQQAYEQQPAYAQEDAGPPADPMEDKLAQLERLGNLKERGVLSEAEFAEQKQRILSA